MNQHRLHEFLQIHLQKHNCRMCQQDRSDIPDANIDLQPTRNRHILGCQQLPFELKDDFLSKKNIWELCISHIFHLLNQNLFHNRCNSMNSLNFKLPSNFILISRYIHQNVFLCLVTIPKNVCFHILSNC